jgi:TRAP-type C4-dicarboxylate transport system permease small subunit
MNPVKVLGVILIFAGILGLAYRGFTYTKKTHKAEIGRIELKLEEKETVDVPMWASIGAIVVGAGLLVVRRKP